LKEWLFEQKLKIFKINTLENADNLNEA
jgi:hypothetical protein